MGGGGVANSPLSTVGWLTVECSTVGWFHKPKKIDKTRKIIETRTVSLKAKISDIPFKQKFFLTSGIGCFAMAQTDRQTDRHCDSMTESAWWPIK